MNINGPSHADNDSESLQQLNRYLSYLFSLDEYVSRSDYAGELKKYEDTIKRLEAVRDSSLLDEYCKRNRLKEEGVRKIIDIYRNCQSIIDEQNDRYVERRMVSLKDYLDGILKDVDPDIELDDDQRRVVLSDEDNMLVIAGAGAGKTTTVAAKAKYLVEKMGVRDDQILIVSFTNKAVDELRQRINEDLKLGCIISTFHAIGNAILKRQTNEQQNIIRDGRQYYVILNYFKKKVFTNPELTRKLLMFFATYFDAPYDGNDLSEYLNQLSGMMYTTLKGDLEDFKQNIIDARTKRMETIQNEIVRSYQEVQIANFLYLNNISYSYEHVYRYNIRFANKPYTPDFLIKQGEKTAYIEHFGISEDGQNDMYTAEQLQKYKKAVNDKILLHREHGTKLIYTFSRYRDGRTLLEHLEEQLKRNGFVLQKKDEKEVLNKIIENEESKYVSRLIILICRFIDLFKIGGHKVEDFSNFKNATTNVRNQLFLDICRECYLEYERYLKENKMIDFQDMINDSAAILRQMADKKEKLRFRYVIVDEYQDISRQCFDLVGALKEVCDAKVMAVGDDWQSIYAFSGSDVNLFLQLEKKMGHAKMLKIENTYRNSQEIIDIAGGFIQKNEAQIRKTLHSNKHIDQPIIIYTYDSYSKDYKGNNKSGKNFNLALKVKQCLEDIIAFNEEAHKRNGRILILGRYGFDVNNLEKSGLFEVANRQGKIRSVDHPDLDLTFMTAHASKGLGYDDVIIINCQNSKFGFPSKIQDDPVLKHVMVEDRSYDYAEERRLFYVAMTRTKNRVYCVAPENYPSQFLVEIFNDYDRIVKKGEWNASGRKTVFKNNCPICGYPLQYRYKPAYGLRLYICTNDPEVCGFMTNDLKGGDMQIMKCDRCQDGYLIVKPGKNGTYFLGCSNYTSDGKGCNNVLTKEQYHVLANLTPESPEAVIDAEPRDLAKERDMSITIDEKIEYEERSYDLDSRRDIEDLKTVVRIVLMCVEHVAQKLYVGFGKINDILCGIEPEGARSIDYKSLPEFGALAAMDRKKVEKVVNILLRRGHLLQTREQYPVIHPTVKGRKLLAEDDDEEYRNIRTMYRKL